MADDDEIEYTDLQGVGSRPLAALLGVSNTVIATDPETGETGSGSTKEEALQDLRNNQGN